MRICNDPRDAHHEIAWTALEPQTFVEASTLETRCVGMSLPSVYHKRFLDLPA
jgi:hypothetical protein